MKKIFLWLITIICTSNSNHIFAQTAQISEKQIPLQTYPFSDPNPVPEIGKIFPYFRYDGYSDKGTVRDWKMVEMENNYIKLWIAPEIGGKIWGAIEKSTGKEFIYYNHAVKFRDVAMRGPWTSGGIEMNFGVIGHAPTCSTPTDYLIRKNDDGSVSCFVGTIDLPSHTRWSVEINLPKDKAYFTTRSVWDNPTGMEQSYYHWMNLGIKTAENLEYVFPGNYHLGHDGKHFSWPIDEQGRKINFYENNNLGSYKSHHVFGEITGFYGAYWHKDDFGFVHYSPYDEKPGKKIWIWGLYNIAYAFADKFVESYQCEPPVIIIDCDDNNSDTHGAQQLSLFNNYYGEYCYMPLHIYEGLASVTMKTLRERFIKIAAQVRELKTKIKVKFPVSCPQTELLENYFLDIGKLRC